MMRISLGLLAAVIALLPACGSTEPAATEEPNLFGEYARSSNVKNDRFPTDGSARDRMASLASRHSADELLSILMSPFSCEEPVFGGECDLDGAVGEAAGDEKVYGRSILVKHEDGSLELLTLYVAGGVLIDSTGETYGSLDEFRENNDLLDSDDLILAARDITSTDGGDGTLVTVSGAVETNWLPWILGGAGVLLVLGCGVVVGRHVTAGRRARENELP